MKTYTAFAWTALMMLTAAVSLQQQTMAQQQFTAGDTVCFTIAAIDTQGDTIRDWDQTGQSCSITLGGSTANVDTSEHSWSAHADGYSYATMLHNGLPLEFVPPHEWTLPNSIFTNGTAEICLVHTKTERGVHVSLCPDVPELQDDTATYNYVAGPVENFLVEITSATALPDHVYLMRKYEFIVSPRDRFLNVSNQQTKCYFTARYPDEFITTPPGFSSPFSGPLYISGPTNFFLASTFHHAIEFGQWIVVVDSTTDAYGRSNHYAVIDHAPGPFELLEPMDGTIATYWPAEFEEIFRWTPSIDPYSNIQLSRFSIDIGNDVVTYSIHFVDSLTLTKKVIFPSDTNGTAEHFTITHAELFEFGRGITGTSFYAASLLWYVEATDGLYVTKSTPNNETNPIPGRYFTVKIGDTPNAVSPIPSAAMGITLHQNYPNPVRAGAVTNIRFETTGYGPVTMKVYDMLGCEVATLADETLAPGVYNADFSASGLAPGVYHYTLTTGRTMTTKSMAVTK